MCGILGITTKKEYRGGDLREMAEILLRLSESRGKEAAGLAVKRNDSIDVLKLPVGAADFLKSVQYKEFSKNSFAGALSIIGHSRLATHGSEANNENNQPVIKDKAVCVHNGIIANDEKLWQQFPQLKRNYQVDTEVFLGILQMFFTETNSLSQAIKKTFEAIEGSASAAVLFNNNYSLILATNTGSLYTLENIARDTFVFASERHILEQFVKKIKTIASFQPEQIRQLPPGEALILDVQTLTQSAPESSSIISHPEVAFHSVYFPEVNTANAASVFKISPENRKSMEENWRQLYSNTEMKRCSKCLLPATMTFIDFDEQGVCNYCRNHQKIKPYGKEALEQVVSKYRRSDGKPDCIVGFSGGRDSSYGLHYVKNVLKMNPIAYTYDWGVLTDLGRRNQARLCGKLGVEQITISADIRRNRKNILTNLNAWLRKPEIGVLPILMAGDKKLLYYGESLKKTTGIELVITCAGSGFENDFFKIGLAGVAMDKDMSFTELPLSDKLKLTSYYAYQYIRNPFYINRSLLDTFFAFYYAIFLRLKTLYLFNYILWDEKEILSTIINEYNWEREVDTSATWRIDDGTAAFYNYVYMTVLGLTEFDVFKSIQIREGQMSKEEAFDIIKEENRPRYQSMEWYASIVGFDINKAINRINEIPRYYLRRK